MVVILFHHNIRILEKIFQHNIKFPLFENTKFSDLY